MAMTRLCLLISVVLVQSMASPLADDPSEKQMLSLISRFFSVIDKNLISRIRGSVGPLLAKLRQYLQIKTRDDVSERMEIKSGQPSVSDSTVNRNSLFPWLRPLIKRSHLDSTLDKYFAVKKTNAPIPDDQSGM